MEHAEHAEHAYTSLGCMLNLSMTITKNIVRRAREIRHELSSRLNRGHTGKALVQCLDQLPEVQAVLAPHFGGRPINGILKQR